MRLMLKAATAAALSNKTTTPAAVADHIFPSSDKILTATKVITAKTATPNLTTQAAAMLLHDVVQFHEALAPVSAFSAILTNPAAATVPPAANRTASAASIGGIGGAWIGEGGRIPLMRGTLASTPVPTGKAATMIALTNDVLGQSPSALEAWLTRALRRAIAKMCDVAILSADAAVPTIRPAGLLEGVTPLTPTTTPQEDVAALLAALSGGKPAAPIIITHPATLVRLLIAWPNLAPQADGSYRLGAAVFVTSEAVATDEVIAVDAAAIAISAGMIQITKSTDAVLVAADADGTAPSVSDSAPPGIVQDASTGSSITAPDGANIISLFQCDCFALRVIGLMGWAPLASDAAAIVTGIAW